MIGSVAAMRFVLVGAAALASPAWAQPVRDARPRSGTGVVSGTVLEGLDGASRPAKRARVSLDSIDGTTRDSVTTDDRGAFRLTHVPAGSYRLYASKAAFLTGFYAATRPARQGAILDVAAGEVVENITLRIVKGGTMTGTVTDENGQPLARVQVMALRTRMIEGGRQYETSASSAMTTDDRGVYRLYGLMPGPYAIAARMPDDAANPASIESISDADVRLALAEVAQAASGRARPGNPGIVRPSPPVAVDRTRVGYAPTYYPGTSTAAEAALVQLALSEERTGIDIIVQARRTAVVSGAVTVPFAVPAIVLEMTSVSTPAGGYGLEISHAARTGPGGFFSFPPVPPGTYRILAMGGTPQPGFPAGGPAPLSEGRLWGHADVVVDGEDVPNVGVTLQPGTTISGRLEIESSASKPVDVTECTVSLMRVQAPHEIAFAPPKRAVGPDGRFTLTGVLPGRYRVVAARQGGGTWQMKSSMLEGQDTLDMPVEIQPGQHLTGVVVTLTDRSNEVRGMVRDRSGRPAPHALVIAFAEDPAQWSSPWSRRIASARADRSGGYVLRGLVPGAYKVAAIEDLDEEEWRTPAFLRGIAGDAVTVPMAYGERTVRDLTVWTNR